MNDTNSSQHSKNDTWLIHDPGYPSCTAHLAVLQRHQSRVVGRTDDLIVSLVGGRAEAGRDVVARQTLGVADGVVLPRLEVHSVQRALQNPVSGSRGVRRFDDDVSDLEDLREDGVF